MDLEHLSEQLKSIHHSFKYINAGGCGVFAKLLGLKLKSEGIRFKYVLLSDNTYKKISLLESMRKFNGLGEEINTNKGRVRNGYNIAHIMIYYKGYFIDSTGVYDSFDKTDWHWYRVSTIISQETLEKWCRQKTWNPTFRRIQVPYIKRRIRKLELI